MSTRVVAPTTLSFSVCANVIAEAANCYTKMRHRTHISFHASAERAEFRSALLTPIGHYDVELRHNGLRVTDSASEHTMILWEDMRMWRERDAVIVVLTADQHVLLPTARLGLEELGQLRGELTRHCKRR